MLLIFECMSIAFSPYGPHQTQRNHFPYVWWMFTTHVLQPSNKSITFSTKPYSSQKVGKQNSTSHSPPCNQFFSPNLTYFEVQPIFLSKSHLFWREIFCLLPRKNFELFSSLIPFLSLPLSVGKHNFNQRGKKNNQTTTRNYNFFFK